MVGRFSPGLCTQLRERLRTLRRTGDRHPNPFKPKGSSPEVGRKGRVQRAASPTTKRFGGCHPIKRRGMLIDMPEVPDGEPFNIINALSAVRRLLTVDEVAELLGKSKFTIYRMAQKKQIPAPLIGGSWKFDPSTLIMWLTKKEPQLAVAARRQRKAA